MILFLYGFSAHTLVYEGYSPVWGSGPCRREGRIPSPHGRSVLLRNRALEIGTVNGEYRGGGAVLHDGYGAK